MNPLLEREGYRIESIVPSKKKTKEKKIKRVEHVKIIDDDAPVPWTAKKETEKVINEEIISVEDDPVVVGVVDDRPAELREKERFNDMKRWRSAAFEEIPDPATIGPQPKPTKKSSRRQKNSDDDDDSDPEIDRRRTKANEDADLSPPRRRTQIKDDPSPPRRREATSSKSRNDDPSPPRRRAHADSDSSPPRRSKHGDSPPRRKHKNRSEDDDPSPPRRHRDPSSPSHRRRDRHSQHESSNSRSRVKDEPRSPSASRRPKQESSPPPPPPAPAPTQPVQSERRRQAEHKEKIAERYAAWGRGVAQVRKAEETVKDYLEIAEKPLARYRDDNDLDAMLKQREREDDPMLKYLSNKASEQGERTSDGSRAPPKPRYRGPDPQKNRFDIWPGYRWDGVDRSNGYERKLFESIASRHAKTQEAYLWSVEDM